MRLFENVLRRHHYARTLAVHALRILVLVCRARISSRSALRHGLHMRMPACL